MQKKHHTPRIELLWQSHTCKTALLAKLMQGIEEESVPCQCTEYRESSLRATALSAKAALLSFLEVGIGIDDKDCIAVHHRRLPPDTPLFLFTPPHTDQDLRRLGSHAARLVKGLPFFLEDTQQVFVAPP